MDLIDKPLVMKLYAESQSDGLEAECTGPELQKISGLSIVDAVRYVLRNYKKKALGQSLAVEVEEILSAKNIRIDIFDCHYERTEAGGISNDQTLGGFSRAEHFKEYQDTKFNPYRI